jgi:hypothetical protein
VRRRLERKAQLGMAHTEIQARAHAPAALERVEYERKLAARDAARAAGKKARVKEPQPTSAAPGPKDQVNFTDPESRIMPMSGGGFEQCCEAPAAVELESRLIVGQRLSDASNDKEQLAPSLVAIAAETGPVGEVRLDRGFLSAAAVRSVEACTEGPCSGGRVLAALERERHGRGAWRIWKSRPTHPSRPLGSDLSAA